ncbi:MAG: hypothetical protein Q9180_003004 [Flavoplaca navasiana]
MTSHGVPRTSGPKVTGQGREKELQRIQEYRTLVDNVNEKVENVELRLRDFD